jgi:CRISPR/Cas system-associated endoribonuclease Cas2
MEGISQENLSNNNDKKSTRKNLIEIAKSKRRIRKRLQYSVFENLKRLKKINYRIKKEDKSS